MEKINKLFSYTLNKFSLAFCIIALSTSVLSETFQLGDLAPRGTPDGQLNAADALILQQIILGNIIPSDEEKIIGNVAPLNNIDDVLNAGDLVVQQRAIMGEITLGTVEISSLPAPTLNAVVSPTTDNPYLITGTASPNADINIYVEDALQHSITSEADGSFAIAVYLYDGMNDIYAKETDGVTSSAASNTVQVQYNNEIDRNSVLPPIKWTPKSNNLDEVKNAQIHKAQKNLALFK